MNKATPLLLRFLDDFIKDKKYEARPNIAPLTITELYQLYNKNNNTYIVSSEHCENTIYPDVRYNLLFRVWHDYLHIKFWTDFTYIGECMTCIEHIYELDQYCIDNNLNVDGNELRLTKKLIVSEIIGQAMYHYKHGKFVDNQIEFTNSFLDNNLKNK